MRDSNGPTKEVCEQQAELAEKPAKYGSKADP